MLLASEGDRNGSIIKGYCKIKDGYQRKGVAIKIA